jgi:hypothetical protein
MCVGGITFKEVVDAAVSVAGLVVTPRIIVYKLWSIFRTVKHKTLNAVDVVGSFHRHLQCKPAGTVTESS